MTTPESWSCYGKDWDGSSSECAGGLDPVYKHPNGTQRRTRCAAFDNCRAATERQRVQQPQVRAPYFHQPTNVVPSTNLVRPQHSAPPVPPPHPFQPTFTHYQTQFQPPPVMPPMMPPTMMAQPGNHATWVPPHVAQFGPTYVPAQQQQFGAQMPHYLTVPEPVDGRPWYIRLIAEITRSMLKAAGHSTASFFDHNPMRHHTTPPQTAAQQPISLAQTVNPQK